ncbi:Hypothetical predicted protein [Podarcis lilfordi]|uniref:Uncharacterized protein n=1 Tax=Podarcis lilfordi TaxID=74358 RepID=A0AA35PJ88_9SAUR|nr:Hypothetical predicted protein [Podarcis lilfordi]
MAAATTKRQGQPLPPPTAPSTRRPRRSSLARARCPDFTGATVISDNGRVCVSVRRRLPPPPILKRMHEPMEVLDFWIGVQLDNFYFHHKRKKATHSMNDIQF